MSLLAVDDAVARLLDGVAPLDPEHLPLHEALGRTLAADLAAKLTQPPFPASAMDGYTVRAADAVAGARLKVVGISRAGERFNGALGAGEAVRIFTGAPVPDGADSILIQENAEPAGEEVRVLEPVQPRKFVRPPGLDFRAGDILLRQGERLGSRSLALAAAMGHAEVQARRRPRVAILANGDELVPPGALPGLDQIVSSNGVGLAALVRECGGEPTDLGIAADRQEAIATLVRKAVSAGADVIVTLGGASVGDHDLIHDVLTGEGMRLDFWKIAMRPGKPLMFGRLGAIRCIGLPGNPVASLVCSQLFLKPLLARLGGRDYRQDIRTARLGAAMQANDLRQDYVRAVLREDGEVLVATPFGIQDSSMLRMLADANGLIVREPFAPAADAGAECRVLMLR